MPILATGGAVFIGSHILEQFEATHDVIVPDTLRSGFSETITWLRTARP